MQTYRGDQWLLLLLRLLLSTKETTRLTYTASQFNRLTTANCSAWKQSKATISCFQGDINCINTHVSQGTHLKLLKPVCYFLKWNCSVQFSQQSFHGIILTLLE